MGFLSGIIMGVYMLFTNPKALFSKDKKDTEDKTKDNAASKS